MLFVTCPSSEWKHLSRSEIRVQYSGLIIFAAQIVSIATGVVFTLLLTRNMSKPEYGIWSNVFDLMGYFTIFSGMFPFWVTRFVARGKEGSIKTGVLANLIVSSAVLVAYFPLVSLATGIFKISGAYVLVYFIGSIQIINLYMISILESCLRATIPQAIGYGLLIEESCKVILAYILIARMGQLFLGAMASLILGASVQTLFYLRLVIKNFKPRIQWNYLKQWLKGSTAIIYNAVGSQLLAFTIILLFVYAGQEARGDYQAAATFANLVGYSSFLAFALYPKMLAKNSLEDVASSFKMVLMFAVPMAAIVMAMAPSLLTVLKVSYSEATPVLILLTLDAVVLTLSQFYTSLIFGVEKLDEKAEIPLKKLAKSRIFKVFTLPYAQAAVALPTVYYILTRSTTGQSVQTVVAVATIGIVVHSGALLGLYAIMRRSVKVPFPWRNMAKYLLAATVPAVALYLIPHPTTLLLTAGMAVGGMAVYAMVLVAIDREARALIVLTWGEISRILRGLRQHPQSI
jgi:O-antigen/teichoic acid export membrane protein